LWQVKPPPANSFLRSQPENNQTRGMAMILIQWQTTGVRCVTIGGFFPKETSAEIENEFEDLVVWLVI
jgi:hypothetical protein